MVKTAIVFGGSGFVGTHLIHYLLETGAYDTIVISDLVAPTVEHASIASIPCDVREPINPAPFQAFTKDAKVTIYNLAAICRIPGYPDRDYFETNIRGADNVCAFAVAIGCRNIVFTGSMAIYGASESEKREDTLPQPDNPYGISKLVAEHIHRTWHAAGPDRNLHILRPGIIFGKGENANFTRLYRGIARGYFFYPGRRDTRKASIYVKDVAALCHHFGEKAETDFAIYNLVYPRPNTIEEICRTLASVTGRRAPWLTIPTWMLMAVSNLLQLMAALIGKRDISFHPDRVRKMMISTNVIGEKLKAAGLELRYSLEEGLEDWFNDCGRTGLS